MVDSKRSAAAKKGWITRRGRTSKSKSNPTAAATFGSSVVRVKKKPTFKGKRVGRGIYLFSLRER